MRSGGGTFVPGWGGVPDEREVGETPLQGKGEVSQGLNREVFSYRWSGDLRLPVKGEVDQGEAFCKVPG